jgi:hypothetical protein
MLTLVTRGKVKDNNTLVLVLSVSLKLFSSLLLSVACNTGVSPFSKL